MHSLRDFEPDALRACANIVRAFDQSQGGNAQAMVRRLLSRAAADSAADPREIADNLGQAIARLLDRLSQRQRDILSRCDGYGENAGAVARSLNISRRHLFRERREALNAIAQGVLDDLPAVQTEREDDPAQEWHHRLKLAALLQERGAWREAADVLEHLAEDLHDPERRGLIEVRLSRLYLRADRLTLASKHAEAARTLAGRTASGRKWRTAEADVAVAWVDQMAYRVDAADRLALRSITALKSWTGTSDEPRIYDALLEALILREDVASGRGDVELALRLMSDAVEIARLPGAARGLKIYVRAFAAVNGALSGKLATPEPVLVACYREALMHGLANEACGMAALLGSIYRRSGRSEAAIDLLGPLAGLAKASPWAQHMRLVYELVNALIDVGQLSVARRHLAVLSELCAASPGRQGVERLTAARLAIAGEAYEDALSQAEAAETIYSQLHLDRIVAEALLLQAQALVGLGNPTRARRVMLPAIEMIEATSGARSAGAAYALMAQITGESKYASRERMRPTLTRH